MGCSNCGSGSSGKPSGCQSNGGCSTGGCNRMNVYDWLADLPISDNAKAFNIIEVSFHNGSRKEFFKNTTHEILEKGDWITVEGSGGYDVGQVSLQGELVKLQMKKHGIKDDGTLLRVLHTTQEDEMESYLKQKQREPELLTLARAMTASARLPMKIAEVEVQADGRKGFFLLHRRNPH